MARIGQQFGAFSSVSQRIREAIARRQIQQAIRLNTTESVDEADRLAIADRLDPAAILELLDDLAGHGDAADVFDVAARHRLAVGDDGERLEGGA